MSQFLICLSEKNLSKYGMALKDSFINKDMYLKVINQYIKEGNMDNIWVIDKIDDMITQLEDNLHVLEEISCQSELMIFWYGSDFQELDQLNSQQELMDYLKNNITNPCLEIDLCVRLK